MKTQSITRLICAMPLSLLMSLFLFSTHGSAQTISTATINDITRYNCRSCTASTTSVDMLNADMVELDALSGNHRLFGFVWTNATSSAGTSSSYFISTTVPSAGSDFGLIGHTLANSPLNIDMAFGSYEYDDTIRYMMNFVFESGGNIYIQPFTIKRTFTTTNFSNALLAQPVKITSSGNAHHPHIDILADNGAGYSASGPVLQHKAVIVWHEQNCLGTNEVFATTCDVSTINANTNFAIIKVAPQGLYADVASVADEPGTGTVLSEHAFITYTDTSRKKLYTTEWNITSNVLSTTTLESSADKVYYPRIEGNALASASFVPGSGADSRWHVVASVKPTSMSNIKVREYNESTNPVNNISDNLNTTDDYLMPVVCGVDDVPTAGSNICNDSFAIAFYGDYNFNGRNEDMYACYMDADNATFGGTQFYEVNKTALSNSFSMTGNVPKLAIATSTNTGRDLFAAWYNGTDMQYKYIGSNGSQFKTAEVNETDVMGANVYPNPASEKLLIEKGYNLNYTITDVLGRSMLSGKIVSGQIDILTLTPGTYIIRLSNEHGKEKTVRFVKE